jgi:hypothetical protein
MAQHQDDSAVQELEKALSSYQPGGAHGGGSGGAMGLAAAPSGAAAGGGASAAAGGVDICSTWNRIKSIVMAGISVLKLLPFGWAKGLANALQELSNALNVMCGGGAG